MMTESDVRESIISCFGINREKFCHDASIYELGIDSIALASLVAHFEQHLGFSLSDGAIVDLMSAQTMGEIVSLLLEQSSAPLDEENYP